MVAESQNIMLTFPAPNRVIEAGPDGPARRAQRANRAAVDSMKEFGQMEQAAAEQLQKRLATLRQGLLSRLGGEFLTDFKQANLQRLLADVDHLIAQSTVQIVRDQEKPFQAASDLGEQAALEPMRAAQLHITAAMPGLDSTLVTTAYDNMADLLTPPMRQFATDTKTSIRRVALAGDNRHEEIQRLQRSISGAGMDNAAYKAERIVRTELGRVFNEATYAKLSALSKDLPFIRKCWRSTKDSRTRIGHIEAGIRYAKGNGIPLGQLFQLRVYNERPKKTPVLIGICTLRFPIDPLAKPEGRIAASATIKCRCNSFVDFDMAAFADYTRQQVTLALGGVKPPAEPAAPAAAKPPKAPKALPARTPVAPAVPKHIAFYKGTSYFPKVDADTMAATIPGAVVVKRTRGFVVMNPAGQALGPGGWNTGAAAPAVKPMKVPKVPKPVVPVGTPISQVPVPVSATAAGPKGVKVSGHLVMKMPKAEHVATIEKALALLDGVHGDGPLPSIPVTPVPQRGKTKNTGAFYMHNGQGRAMGLGFTGKLLKNTPNMTVFHETGHFLDNKAFGEGGTFGSEGGVNPALPPAAAAALQQVRDTMASSQAYQTLVKWNKVNILKPGETTPEFQWGKDGIPSSTDRGMVSYLLKSRETFARAYAQYVAVKSGDPAALKELAKIQASSKPAVVGVEPTAAYQQTPTLTGKKHVPGTWSYPWAWQDDDFAPIQRAFDQLFEVAGWRK